MKVFKKLFKFIFRLVITIVVVAVLFVLTLPFWIGPVVRTAANRKVPEIVGTDFRLGEFGFNFYTGRLRLGDVKLANPTGYTPKNALEMGRFNIDLDVASLFEDTIVVHELLLRDVFVSYVKKDGKYNFDVIAENVKAAVGEEDDIEDRSAQGEPRNIEIDIEIPEHKGEEPTTAPEGEGNEDEEPSKKKVMIDRIEISGITVQVQWCPVPLPVPTIVIRDIGRESGGVDWDVAWREICAQVLSKINSLGQGLINIGEQLGSAATNSAAIVSAAIVDGSAAVTNITTDAVNTLRSSTTETVDTVKVYTTETVDSLKESATNTVGALSFSLKEGASATAETTSDMLSATTDATSSALKYTGDATVDALKATGDATKDALKATGETFKSAGKELKSVGKDIKNMFKKQ